jgi:hypothetical protein
MHLVFNEESGYISRVKQKNWFNSLGLLANSGNQRGIYNIGQSGKCVFFFFFSLMTWEGGDNEDRIEKKKNLG